VTDLLLDTKPKPADTVAGPAGQVPKPSRSRRKSSAHVWIGLALLASAAAAGALWWRGHAGTAISYTTAAIDRGPISRTIAASGAVNPVLTVIVGSYVSGVIQDIACDYNTSVRKGQVCATIDPRPYRLVVEQDRADLASAKAQLSKDQASLAYAEASYGRQQTLWAEDSTSRDAVDSARSQRDQVKAQIAVDLATIRQRQAALDAAQVNLGYTRIVSPVNGTVVSRNITIGQTVAASFQTPTLFLIAQDLTRMQVDTNVSESDVGGYGRTLQPGDPASFTVEAYPNRVFHGVVAQVRQAPQTVQNVVTYDVVVAVSNEALLLKPGMTATVKIVTDQHTDAVRVPNQALRYTPGGLAGEARGGGPSSAHGDRVWILKDGRPTTVAVRAGLQDESFTELLSTTLKPGQAVVIGESGAARRARPAPTPRL
jgi:HlyD family secretion protein